MSETTGRSAPPRWFMRLQWRAHKAIWNVSGGRLGAKVMGMPVIELITTGNRSGRSRSILITAIRSDGGWAIAGTNAGATADPAWVRNLRANPVATVKTAGGVVRVTAAFLSGADHERMWERFVGASDDYAHYAKIIERPVPLVLLRPNT